MTLTKACGILAAVCGLFSLHIGASIARLYRGANLKLTWFAQLYMAQVELRAAMAALILICCVALLATGAQTSRTRAAQGVLLFALCLLCVPAMSTVAYFSTTAASLWSSYQ